MVTDIDGGREEMVDAPGKAMVTGQDYIVFDLLHGVVEHGTYHGGQSALLEKA